MGLPMNILLVKLSSLGDVLHNLPVVWDLRQRYPDARIDWVVEEGYAALLEPMRQLDQDAGIDRIIAFGLRRWRRDLRAGHWAQVRAEFGSFRAALRARTYDLIVETQGLIKSAVVTRLAHRSAGAPIAGLANRTEYSGYEPMARWCYNMLVEVPGRCHAVDRSRLVAAAAARVTLPAREASPPRFYPLRFMQSLQPMAGWPDDYVLCFHSTARAAKRWSMENWIELGRALRERGMTPVFPWGSDAERDISVRLAAAVAGAEVPAAFSIQQAYSIVAGARLVIGVDTGLTHLAAILGRPTIELYCDSPRWKTEGYWSDRIRNLGDRGAPPALGKVAEAMDVLLDKR